MKNTIVNKKEEILTHDDVCKELSIAKNTLAQWRSEGKINYYSMGRKKIYYKWEDVEKCKNTNTVYCNKASIKESIKNRLGLS